MGNADEGGGTHLGEGGEAAARHAFSTLLKTPSKNPLGKPS